MHACVFSGRVARARVFSLFFDVVSVFRVESRDACVCVCVFGACGACVCVSWVFDVISVFRVR